MTPPQPTSQTLRERAKRILGCLRELSANHGLKSQVCEDYVLHQLKAALAAQEASPQPDLAREWFAKGWDAREGQGYCECLSDADFNAAYLAACRQEQP